MCCLILKWILRYFGVYMMKPSINIIIYGACIYIKLGYLFELKSCPMLPFCHCDYTIKKWKKKKRKKNRKRLGWTTMWRSVFSSYSNYLLSPLSPISLVFKCVWMCLDLSWDQCEYTINSLWGDHQFFKLLISFLRCHS